MLLSFGRGLKEVVNVFMFSVFLSSFRNTQESLGKLEKTTTTARVPTDSISRLPKLPPDRNTVHVFFFLNEIYHFFTIISRPIE